MDALLAAGVARLRQFQHDDGLFSIWCGGNKEAGITARVAHRLSAIRDLPYPDAHDMLGKAVAALVKAGHRDNQLLPLDRRFLDKLRSVKDAVSLYFHGNGERPKALEALRKWARVDGESARWEGKAADGYWGGDLEATADATRVMWHAHDPLFRAGFQHVGSKVVNGMLFSTADTRALVELFASIDRTGSRARVDGKEVTVSEPIVAQEVEALDDDLVVRVDEEREIDWLAPRKDFAFKLDVKPTKAKLGERVKVTITLKEDSICPLARIWLPGPLALLRAGANAQTACLPVGVSGYRWVGKGHLEVEAVAVRRGRGAVRVAVHDLYDAEKIGVASPIDVRVDAP